MTMRTNAPPADNKTIAGFSICPNENKFSFTDGDNGSLIIEGWLSVAGVAFPRHSDFQWMVEPGAFTDAVIREYMQKPIVLWMHDMMEIAVGKTLSIERRTTGGPANVGGAWIKVVLFSRDDKGNRNPDGEALIAQIRNGIICSFSYAWVSKRKTTEETVLDNGATRYLTIHQEYEYIQEVSICNLGMNEGAVFSVAESDKFKNEQ